MRRALTYVGPWAGVTALAVMLSWLGVRDVVGGAIFEDKNQAPVAGPVIHASPSSQPSTPETAQTPIVRPSPVKTTHAVKPPPKRSTPNPPPPPPPAPSHSPTQNGKVRSYVSKGGRAVLALGSREARLISATPNPGYETSVTKATGWLRIDFLKNEHSSTVIATFYRHTPTVQVYEY